MPRNKPPQRKLKVLRLSLLIVGVLVLVGATAVLHYFQVRRQSGQLLIRADAQAQAQEWSAAAALYKSYVKIRRDQPEVLASYATILEELRKSNPEVLLDIQKVYEELLALEPERSQERRKLVRVYLQMQQFPAAEVNLKTLSASKTADQDVELQILWADWHQFYSKNYALLAEHLRKAIATGQAEPIAYGRLARLLKLDLKPPTPENDTEAEAVMAKLLQDHPKNIMARLTRADYRFYFHGPDAAREEVLYAYRNIPDGATSPDVAIALQRLAVSAEDMALAREAITRAIEAQGEDPRLRIALADVLSRGSDRATAIKTLQEAIANAPPDIVLVEVSERLLAMGDSKTARVQADRLETVRRMSQFAPYLRGRAALVEGNWPEAIEPLRRSVAAFQNYPQQQFQARLALADCFRQGNQLELRREELREAEKLDPRSASVKYALAECLAELGQTTAAMELYTAILPQMPSARLPLARLRLAQQAVRPEPERNWVDLESLLRVEPLSGELFVVKANMYFLREQPEQALKVLEEACQKSETGPAPRVALVAAVALKDRALAGKLLDRFEQEWPNTVDLRLARARYLLQEEKLDRPRFLQLAENREPFTRNDRVKLCSGLGELLAQRGYLDDAITLFRQALAETPNDIQLLLTLYDLGLSTADSNLRLDMRRAIVRLEGVDGPTAIVVEVSEWLSQSAQPTARSEEMIKRTKLAREARPNWPRVHVLLGDLQRQAKQTDAAIEHYREALKVGDQSDRLLRTMMPLLLEQSGQQELLELLAKRSRLAPLPADLAQQLALLRSIFAEEPEKSLAWARSPQALASKDYRDHLRRATIFVAGKAFPDARLALEKALSLNNTAPDAWLAMIQFLVLTERPDEAIAARNAAESKMRPLANTPAEKANVERVRAVGRELTNDPAAAEAALKAAIALDPAETTSHEALVQFLIRTDRQAEALALLGRLIPNAQTPQVRRWARRTLAMLKVSGPDAYAERGAALQLIETNLAEAGQLVEDVRLKALILALDPFQQAEAIATLLDSTKRGPLNAEQSYRLARLYLSQGDLQKADETLRASTRAVSLVAPEHLALLVQIQVKRALRTDARQTLDRLKMIAPKNWLSISEEARVLAAEGKTDQASKLLLSEFGSQPRTILIARVAPFLEQIGGVAAARQVLTELASDQGADSHFPLVGLLIRQGSIDEAWKLVAKRLNDSTPGPTARLIGALARSQPLGLVPPERQAAWKAELANAERWIRGQQTANPESTDFLLGLADLADAQGQHDRAIAGYREVLAKNAEHPIALNNLAVLLALHTRDRSSNSLQLIDQLMARRGPQPTYLDTRSLVHMVAERYEEASRDLEAAIRMDPKPVYQFHLAVVYDKLAVERPALAEQRDALLKIARSQGLTKQQLHPREWEEYDRLMAQLGA